MLPFTNEIYDNDGPIWVNKFNEDSARAFVKQLQYQSTRNPEQPIVIYIDSYGGEVHALFTMISALEAVPNQIITVALGKAMSAGAFLLSCGDLRYASQHCSIMVHEMSGGTGGHIADLNNQHANSVQTNEHIMKYFAKKCERVKGGFEALKKEMDKVRDFYITPENAVKFGMIDRIGVPTLSKKLQVEWSLNICSRQQPPSDKKQETKDEKPKSKKPAAKAKI